MYAETFLKLVDFPNVTGILPYKINIILRMKQM